MGWHYTSPIWKLNLASSSKLVLLKFGDACNDDSHLVWCGLKTVASEVGLSLDTVKRQVKAFRHDRVLIAVENAGSGRRHAVYRIDLNQARRLYGNRKKGDVETQYCRAGCLIEGGTDQEKVHDAPQTKGAPCSGKGAPCSGKGAPCTPNNTNREEKERGGADAPAARGAADPSPPAANREPYGRLWEERKGQVRDGIGEGSFNAWLKDAIPVDPGGARAVPYQLGVPTRFYAEHINANFAEQVAEALGRPAVAVVFDPRASATARRVKQQKEAEA